MNKLILIDMDETVLNFTDPMMLFLHQQGFTASAPNRSIYSIAALVGCSEGAALDLIQQFQALPDFGALEPEPCAKRVLPMLHAEGYRFLAITAVDDSGPTRALRMENFKKAFGFDLVDCVCVGLRGDKRSVLEKFAPTVWVEDNPHHAEVGGELGHTSFLLTRGYNIGHQPVNCQRVRDWYDVAQHLGVKCWDD